MPAFRASLKRELGVVQYVTIGVGSIIGIAWVMMLGDWLEAAGPLGAILAFIAGGALVTLIAACYSELATWLPYAGGEVVYAHELFGPRTAFGVGWFLVLAATATTSFEAVSFARLLAIVFPVLQGSELYRVMGSTITVGGLALGAVGTAVMTAANVRGVKASARLQDWFTAVKVIAVTIFIIAGLAWGDARNLPPLLHGTESRPAWVGAVWIAATAPFWFGGFQIIPQAIEERRATTSLRSIAVATLVTVLIGVIFYCLVITAAAMAGPRELLSSGDLPAARAMQAVLGSPLFAKVILLATIAGVLATWNACIIWASRLLLALGRAEFVPAYFGQIHSRFGTPANAVYFVCGLCALGVFFGRSILLPVVNMGAISLALVYVVTCVGVLRSRRLAPDAIRAFRVPGGRSTILAAIMAAVVMAGFVVFEPLTRSHGFVPIEWVLLFLWAVVGGFCWALRPDTGGKSA